MRTFYSWDLRFALILFVIAFGVRPAAADSRFLVPPVYPVQLGPAGVASADFNGDGKPDLVVANNNANSISVLLNHGNGTFLPAVNYSAGEDMNPTSVVVADFDGDGKLDIAASGQGCCGGQIVVFIGNGDGTFKAGVPYKIEGGGNDPGSVVAADLDGDGKLDLIVCSMNTSSALLNVLLGNGDGTFKVSRVTTLNLAGGVRPSLVVGNFNKDSKPDVAVELRGQLNVFLGNGNGTFQTPGTSFGQLVNSLAVGDMNGDGALDLVSANTGGSVSVWLGNGDGTFRDAVTSAASQGGPQAIALGDLNGDGKLDVVIGGPSASVSVFFGDGTASLRPPVVYAVGTGPAFSGAVWISDLNGDGFPDVVCTNDLDSTVTILFGSRTGALQSLVESLQNSGPLAVGQFNHDGHLDVVSSVQPASDLGLWLGNGKNRFQDPASFVPVGNTPLSITAADFNGDGAMDAATSNKNTVSVLFGDGQGKFQPAVNYGTTFNIGTKGSPYITSADLNHDGKPDLGVVTTLLGSTPVVAIMLNHGDGTFQPAVQYAFKGHVEGLAFADFNGDGILDMVVTVNDNRSFPASVLLGNGDGTFQTPVNYEIGLGCPQVMAADVNNDGKQDLVLACGVLAIMLGNGDGSFQRPTFNTSSFNTTQIATGDLTGSGIIDVASAGTDLGVYYGNGDGSFNYVNYGLAAQHVAIGNFNGDNAPDLIFNGGNLGVLGLANTGGTSAVLMSSSNPSKVNQTVQFQVTFKATVNGSPGGTPTGSVTFRDGTHRLGTMPLNNGTASFATSTLSAGRHKITAVYSGDGHFNHNQARTLLQTVTQ
jgi:hypothetical protein